MVLLARFPSIRPYKMVANYQTVWLTSVSRHRPVNLRRLCWDLLLEVSDTNSEGAYLVVRNLVPFERNVEIDTKLN